MARSPRSYHNGQFFVLNIKTSRASDIPNRDEICLAVSKIWRGEFNMGSYGKDIKGFSD